VGYDLTLSPQIAPQDLPTPRFPVSKQASRTGVGPPFRSRCYWRLVNNMGSFQSSARISKYYHDLAATFVGEYNRTGREEPAGAAVIAARQAVKYIPANHPDRDIRIGSLGFYLWLGYTKGGHIADLEEGVSLMRQAAEMSREGAKGYDGPLRNLALGLLTLYQRTQTFAVLEESVEVARRGVALGMQPQGSASREESLSLLGWLLRFRYHRTGKVTDLEEAIQCARRCMQLDPPDAEGRLPRPHLAAALGDMLLDKYAETRQLAQLHEPIRLLRQALAQVPDDCDDRLTYLAGLATALARLWERGGDGRHLDEALHAARQTVSLAASQRDKDYYIAYKRHLVSLLRKAHHSTGDRALALEARRNEQQDILVPLCMDDDPNYGFYISDQWTFRPRPVPISLRVK
jgi:tetratricopeptide (TPR) repeat protein